MPGGAGHDQFDGEYFTRAGGARSRSPLAQLASLLWPLKVSDDGALLESRRMRQAVVPMPQSQQEKEERWKCARKVSKTSKK